MQCTSGMFHPQPLCASSNFTLHVVYFNQFQSTLFCFAFSVSRIVKSVMLIDLGICHPPTLACCCILFYFIVLIMVTTCLYCLSTIISGHHLSPPINKMLIFLMATYKSFCWVSVLFSLKKLLPYLLDS